MVSLLREPSSMARERSNADVARLLDEVAELLTAEAANPFRITAYRKAAVALRNEKRSVAELWRESGQPALRAIPGIGASLANSIDELLKTGRLERLEELREKTACARLANKLAGHRSPAGRTHSPGFGDRVSGRSLRSGVRRPLAASHRGGEQTDSKHPRKSLATVEDAAPLGTAQ